MEQTISNNIDYSICNLSIQVGLNGFSFCIRKEDASILIIEAITFASPQTPEKLLTHVEKGFNKFPYLSEVYNKTTVVYQNQLFTLVPKEIFDPEQPELYLQYSVRTLATDFVAYDELSKENLIVVYVPYVNINNFFFEKYGSFSYYHSQTVFLKTMLAQPDYASGTWLFCNIQTSFFELLILKEGKVQLLNSFIYETKEDFLYYVLFAMEQLELQSTNITLHFIGIENEENPLYRFASKYIREVKIISIINVDATSHLFKEAHNYFTLLNTNVHANYIGTT